MSANRILVVEDEFLVALDMETILADAGFDVVGPVGSVADALRLIAAECPAVALLDNNLNGESVGPVAARLHTACVRFAFVTGNDRESLPAAFQDAPLLRKPFTPPALIATARSLISAIAPIAREIAPAVRIPG